MSSNSLSCRARIDQLAAALRVVMRIVPAHAGYQNSVYLIELKSDGRTLTLTSSSGTERAAVSIPCQGDDFTVLVRGSEINKSIFKGKIREVIIEHLRSKRRGNKLVLHLEEDHIFDVYDEEKYALLDIKRISRRNRIELTYPGPMLCELMDYLMKARNEKEDKPIINGLIFTTNKLALTDGHHMHVQGLAAPLSFQAILPKAATDALYVGLQKFTPATVRLQYAPGNEAFVVVFTFDDSPGVSVRIDAGSNEVPDRFDEVCPPLDEAIVMVLARDPFEQLLREIIKKKVDALRLVFDAQGLRYHYEDPTSPPVKDEEGNDTGEIPETWGALPSARISGTTLKERGFNPKFLLQAIETLGDPIQIIQPWVRSDVRNEDGEVVAKRAGEDDDGQYPIVVNGQMPLRYALLMPMR